MEDSADISVPKYYVLGDFCSKNPMWLVYIPHEASKLRPSKTLKTLKFIFLYLAAIFTAFNLHTIASVGPFIIILLPEIVQCTALTNLFVCSIRHKKIR